MTRQARILLALDEGAAAAARGALEAAHHEVRSAASEGLERVIATFRPDVVIIDLPVDDPNQAAVTVQRVHASYRPILMWAVRGGAPQRATALEVGADSCIDAPFSTNELVLSVRALLRRSSWLAGRVHRVGGVLTVDEEAHVIVADGQTIHVSRKEFNLLAMLASHAGTVLSKRTLLDAVWGYDAYDENLVEVHMSALRRRLPPRARSLIHTVRGVGYVLREGSAQGQLA